MMQKAVIYCRVSSPDQVKNGHGLSSQETRCREFAKYRTLDVVEVFPEEGISGGLIDRPAMKRMLDFMRQHKNEQIVVIIDDISRLARGLKAHLELRMAIQEAGGVLQSPSIEFGEDSDSQLVENLLASVSQHQRQKNAEQVKNRMRARLMNGYWVFPAPVGYRYERVNGEGKIMVKDEPLASIVKEVFEGYASGKYASQGDVRRFLTAQAAYPKDANGEVHFQRLAELFERVIYTGYIDYPVWDIILKPGKHEPLISYETFKRVQERLKEQAHAPARKDIHMDFPLRGYVLCDCCGYPMTACWSHGRHQKFAYYLCQQRGCEERKKSIRKDVLESEFENLLKELQPSPKTLNFAGKLMRMVWEKNAADQIQNTDSVEEQIRQAQRKIDQLIDRITATDNPTLLGAYETKLKKLEEEKVLLGEKIGNCGRETIDFDKTYRTIEGFLANPQKIWYSEDIVDRKGALKLLFREPLRYRRNRGYRTPAKSLPFSLFEAIENGKSDLVPAAGLEPARP